MNQIPAAPQSNGVPADLVVQRIGQQLTQATYEKILAELTVEQLAQQLSIAQARIAELEAELPKPATKPTSK